MKLDINELRKEFPILRTKVNNEPLVYLDNASTTQKPVQVIQAIGNYYFTSNSNVHRGNHYLSIKATEEFENVRKKVQQFINAKSEREVIFTRGTTESINLIASSFGKEFVKNGDEIVISAMEHHSNIVPWQLLCNEKGAKLKVIPINNKGEIIFDEFEKILSSKTKIVAITHISNTLGTINPIKQIVNKAHNFNIPVLVDGAQAAPHLRIDVQNLDVDYYCFSGHKVYGPTGIGILYGKVDALEKLPPYQGGGEMISTVTFEKTTYNELPYKFEAGTPDIAGAIGLGAALDYLESKGFDDIKIYEDELLKYATEKLLEIDNLKIYGTSDSKTSVISFNIGNHHPADIGTLLDKMGIAVRTGNHCTQPIIDKFGIPGTIRASFAFYNTSYEVDSLVEKLNKAVSMLSG